MHNKTHAIYNTKSTVLEQNNIFKTEVSCITLQAKAIYIYNMLSFYLTILQPNQTKSSSLVVADPVLLM